MSQPDPRAVLDTPMGDNDADAGTIRDYLSRVSSAGPTASRARTR
jgi:hypothetical protein